jgi:hypothetical protein
VGFRFVNGTIIHEQAQDIAYWYTDHSFPVETWYREYQAAGGDASKMVHRTPSTVLLRGGARVSFYGSDFHDIGDDAMSGYNLRDLRLQGVHGWNIDEKSYDPGTGGANGGDLIHNDMIGTVHGFSGLTVHDSFLEQRLYIGAQSTSTTGISFRNVWARGSRSAGFIFNSQNGNQITGERVNVYSWGHNNGLDRFDLVGEQEHPGGSGASTTGIDVRDVNVVRSPPPPDALDPATRWRERQPYESWRSVLPGDSGPPALHRIVAALVVAIAAALLWLMTRRRPAEAHQQGRVVAARVSRDPPHDRHQQRPHGERDQEMGQEQQGGEPLSSR